MKRQSLKPLTEQGDNLKWSQGSWIGSFDKIPECIQGAVK